MLKQVARVFKFRRTMATESATCPAWIRRACHWRVGLGQSWLFTICSEPVRSTLLAGLLDRIRLLSGLPALDPRNPKSGGFGHPQTVPVPVRHTERGQALIEVAFVFPIILVFLLVIVDFGFAFDRREVIQHAVREGARSAAVGADAVATTSEQSGGILTNIQVCYRDVNTNNPLGGAGDSVQVSGEYTYNFMIGSGAFLSGAIPGINMSPSSEARLEKSVPNAGACP